MKKIFVLLMVLFLAVGCSTTQSVQKLKVLAPNGAPALSLLSVYQETTKEGEIRIVEGSDILSSELVKKDSAYDAIIAPINLGCQLIAKGQTDYKLAGVITWGNLYLVENPAIKDNTLAAFGKQAVPGKILTNVQKSSDILKQSQITFFNAVSDVQGQVLSGKTHYALMAEPAASATIAKAKQNQMTLKIVEDLQALYQKQMNSQESGYPQAALFVKDQKKCQALIDELDTFTNKEATEENIKNYVDEIGAKVFGMPNAQIVTKTWEHQNIHYKDARDVQKDIETLLKQFGIQLSEDMFIS